MSEPRKKHTIEEIDSIFQIIEDRTINKKRPRLNSDNSNNTQVMSYRNVLLNRTNNSNQSTSPLQKPQFTLKCNYVPIQSPTTCPKSQQQGYTAVVDSGAGAHMTSAKELFQSLIMYYDKEPDI